MNYAPSYTPHHKKNLYCVLVLHILDIWYIYFVEDMMLWLIPPSLLSKLHNHQ